MTLDCGAQNFLTRAYPILVNIYGPPATTGTLTLVQGGTQTGVEGGEFNASTMTLTLEPLPTDFATTDGTQYGYNLLHLILHAFHAPALIGFDAWEEGMARAAATVKETFSDSGYPVSWRSLKPFSAQSNSDGMKRLT